MEVHLTVLAHKTPCKKCPWRRDSLPGWLGSDTPEGFLQTTIAGAHMPCHCAVDYEQRHWEDQIANAPHCAGSLVFLTNICKLPHDDRIVEFRRQVEADRTLVFATPQQFLDHHNRTAIDPMFSASLAAMRGQDNLVDVQQIQRFQQTLKGG